MLTNSLNKFISLLEDLRTDDVELVFKSPTSRSFSHISEKFTFTVELSEARVHSFINKNDFKDDDWSTLVKKLFSINCAYEIILWNEDKIIKSTETNANPLSVTQIEFSSNLINIENIPILLEVVCGLHSWTVYYLQSTLSNYSLNEGAEISFLSKRYERSKLLREIAIKIHGLDCLICGLNFEARYGELGRDFIHVHHLERVADKGNRLVNPMTDLVPVCANCHAMLHRATPPLLPEDLKRILND